MPILRYPVIMIFLLIPLAICGAILAGTAARACDTQVCLIDPAKLRLSRVITFDDLPVSPGIGRAIDQVLVRPGARFGERFLGQSVTSIDSFDTVHGIAVAPLTAVAGAPGQTLGALRLLGTTVLHGHGAMGFPSTEAVGEGSVAVAFDDDQTALSLDIRGGEQGQATVVFLRRDGSILATLILGPLSEQTFGFIRKNTIPDIAGFLLLNTDPQGISLDNLRFDNDQLMGTLRPYTPRHNG